MKRVIISILFSTVLPATAETLPPEAILTAAADDARPIPVLSKRGHVLTLEQAYSVQRQYVEACVTNGESVVGFKAGLTSEASRRRFEIFTPVSGVLLRSAQLEPGARLAAGPSQKLMLETELGYVFGQAVTNAILDDASMRAVVERIVPAIEIPNLGFEDLTALKGVDVVAANVATHRFLVGRGLPIANVDPNAVTVSCTMGTNVVNTGRGSDAMGNQWRALRWLVNNVVGQGWAVEPGQILITGALGNMIPGAPGRYRADFGELGSLEFGIEAEN